MSFPEYMQVKMPNRLPAVVAGIDHHAIAAVQFLLARDLNRSSQQATQQRRFRRRGVRQRRMVRLGDEQHMHRCLRIDIRKRQHFIGLIQPSDGNGAGSDLAEEAIGDSRH